MKMPMFCRVGRVIVAGALFAMAYPMSVVAQNISTNTNTNTNTNTDTVTGTNVSNLLESVLVSAGFTAVWTVPGSSGVTHGHTMSTDATVSDSQSTLRYPIQPIRNDNLVHACLKLGAMYRNDFHNAQVIVRLQTVDMTIANSQPQTVMTIDSDAYPNSENFQVRDVTINSWFNFNYNVYYVEVEMTKGTGAMGAGLRWLYLAAPLSSAFCPS